MLFVLGLVIIFVTCVRNVITFVTFASLNFSYTPGCSVEYCSSIYRDCGDYWFLNHKKSGVYRVIPKDMTRGYDVYCEMTADSAWLVRQIPLATSTTINYLYRSPKLS